MKRIILIGLAVLALSIGIMGFASPNTAYAIDSKAAVCAGVNQASGNGCKGSSNLTGIFKTIINLLSILVGIVAVIMIIFGGFKYVTSGGDSGKIGSAKNTLIYAVVGLVIVALSQVIVQFVLSSTK